MFISTINLYFEKRLNIKNCPRKVIVIIRNTGNILSQVQVELEGIGNRLIQSQVIFEFPVYVFGNYVEEFILKFFLSIWVIIMPIDPILLIVC